MTNPKKGRHNMFCFMCSKSCGEVTHYGGKKRLKWCDFCSNQPAPFCLDCYMLRPQNLPKKPKPRQNYISKLEQGFTEEMEKLGVKFVDVKVVE